jgi:hypothetical protein
MTRARATHLSLSIMAVAVAACSHASPGNGSPDYDGGTLDGTACIGAACEEDDAEVDAFVVDTGWACPVVPESNVGASCDTCVQTHCDAAWCKCAQDTGTSDGGVSACLAYLSCLATCPADGGEAGPCSGCSSGAFTPAEQLEGQALSSCIAQSCAPECPGAANVFL